MRIGAALRRQACRLGFQADAQLEHRDHIGHRGEILLRYAEVAAPIARADEGADAVPRFNQIRGLQPGQGFAHHGAADIETGHDFCLGRQFLAYSEGAGPDLALE